MADFVKKKTLLIGCYSVTVSNYPFQSYAAPTILF